MTNYYNESDFTSDGYLILKEVKTRVIIKLYELDIINPDKIELYNTQWNISTWIYRIAYVNACGYLRAMRTSKTTPMSYFENSNDMDLTSKIEFQSIDGYKDSLELSEESEVISKQNSNLLDLVESLDSQFSNVLRDKFWENMKYEEIADKYEIPLQTVKNRIFRGKNMLNEKYVKLYGIPII